MANCGNCGGPVRLDGERGVFVCPHCGSTQDPPGAIEPLEMLTETSAVCPTCSAPLSTGRLDGYSVLCCGRCFGLLIDMNQFATVIDAVRVREPRSFRTSLPRRQNPGERVLNCPKCRQPMLSHLYGGPGNVVIDSCEQCLVNWLDAGEIRRIAIAPDSGPARDAD